MTRISNYERRTLGICGLGGCTRKAAPGRGRCAECGSAIGRRLATSRTDRSPSARPPDAKECTIELRSIGKPPWPEFLIDSWSGVDHHNGGWRTRSEERRNPERPNQWHEAIHLRRGVVLWRSVKPVEKLRPLLQRGERLVLAVRFDVNANYTRVRRYWL